MPDQPDDPGLPLDANGPAYTSHEVRHGVPLSYVAEQLRLSAREIEWPSPSRAVAGPTPLNPA